MKWNVAHSDILDWPADVLVLSGNPQLNLSGGVGGAFAQRYGDEMQNEMHAYLASTGKACVERGAVVSMPPCGSGYMAVLHAVGIDVFYDATTDDVGKAVGEALRIAAEMGAETVAMAAVATGYGKMSMEDFGDAIAPLIESEAELTGSVTICLQKADAIDQLICRVPLIQRVE